MTKTVQYTHATITLEKKKKYPTTPNTRRVSSRKTSAKFPNWHTLLRARRLLSTLTEDGRTLRSILEVYMARHVRNGKVRLTYNFCQVGQALVDHGLIEGARVYAQGDPFQLPGKLNDLLTGSQADNYDDESAYATYLQALTTDKKTLKLLKGVPEMRDELAGHYRAQAEEIKNLLNRLMMDGTVAEWRRQYKIGESDDHDWIDKFATAL